MLWIVENIYIDSMVFGSVSKSSGGNSDSSSGGGGGGGGRRLLACTLQRVLRFAYTTPLSVLSTFRNAMYFIACSTLRCFFSFTYPFIFSSRTDRVLLVSLSSFYFGNHIGCRIINKFNLTYTTKTCQNMLVSSCLSFFMFILHFFFLFVFLSSDTVRYSAMQCAVLSAMRSRWTKSYALAPFVALHCIVCEGARVSWSESCEWLCSVYVFNWMSLLYALA